MAADFKSHVLMRDEKGFMGIPFKRLLLAGVCGGLTYTLARLASPDWSIPVGIAVAVFALVMTGTLAHLLPQRLHVLWDAHDGRQQKQGTDPQRPHTDEQNSTAQSDSSRKRANEQRRARRTNVLNEILDSQRCATHFG